MQAYILVSLVHLEEQSSIFFFFKRKLWCMQDLSGLSRLMCAALVSLRLTCFYGLGHIVLLLHCLFFLLLKGFSFAFWSDTNFCWCAFRKMILACVLSPPSLFFVFCILVWAVGRYYGCPINEVVLCRKELDVSSCWKLCTASLP